MSCTDMARSPLVPGDIVQVLSQENLIWVGCLFIVDEVKSWGIQGDLTIPDKGDIWVRLESKDIIWVGRARLWGDNE